MKIVSLFTGAGGLDLGMIKAGHTIVWANDHDPDCVETYKKNIGKHIVLGDIEGIEMESIPDCDVVLGGFPCQGFSQANLRRGPNDKRNFLYHQFLRVLKAKKPKVFIAENVRGILSLDSGNAIKKIIKDFEHIGYRVKYDVFNVADYGVPQTRIRVIIIGLRNDLPENITFTFPEPTHAKAPYNGKIKKWVSIQEALEKIPDPDDYPDKLPNQIYSKYKVTNRNFTGHRRTDPSKPSPTILARGNGKGGVCAIQHPDNHRRLSIRESATIQKFPTSFEFIGKMNSCYRQIGNAVPVSFAKQLGIQLVKFEKNIDKRTMQ
jgi:DNA (cytosine-5)-methyltransferase 1